MHIEYPPGLAAVPEYAEWLQTRIRKDIAEGVQLDDMAVVLAFPPDPQILTFRSCIWVSLQSCRVRQSRRIQDL